MSLGPGSSLGPYRIEAAIGAGGMGAVWKARDTRLDRTVAIKTIEGRFNERFEREAKTIASLNHPHICTLFDVGENYLVMEFIDGLPVKGPLPVAEVVKLGAQIADALDAAHRKGITHRDLKPGNVLVNKAGAKVIDFGLAKSVSPAPGEQDVTLTNPLTSAGMILGTVPYMSPEQLHGQEADARSDIFALGCVLYEMLTGRRAFTGKSHVSIMAAILEHEPAPLTQPATPAWLDRIIRRCLRKNPDDRWQSARDIAIELRDPQIEPGYATNKPLTWVPWGAAAAASAIALALWLRHNPGGAGPGQPVRLFVEAPDNTHILGGNFGGSASISPDGRSVVFVGRSTDPKQSEALWIRPIDSADARVLVAGAGVRSPCWSPDSRWIAFRAGSQIRKVEVATGRTVTIVSDGPGLPGAWTRDGRILLAGPSSLIGTVSDSGGQPQAITRLEPGQRGTTHSSPALLPDDRHFVFNASNVEGGTPGLYVASLDNPAAPKKIGEGTRPRLAGGGGREYLLYIRDGEVVAQRFDIDRLELVGPTQSLAGLDVSGNPAGIYSVSDTGVLAVLHGQRRRMSEPRWFTRNGASQRAGPPGAYRQPRLTEGGKRAIVERSDTPATMIADIWMLDPERGALSRVLGEKDSWEYHPVWSSDGTEILYATVRNAASAVMRRRLADGRETRLLSIFGPLLIGDWTPDTRHFVYTSGSSVMAASADGPADQRGIRLTNSQNPHELYPRISPDGKWVAFSAVESGSTQVYVAPFDPSKPAVRGKTAVSASGGDMPAWRGDGKEIFYLAPDGLMMAVPVIGLAPEPRFGTPQPLFDSGIDATISSYDVTPDGQRFLVLRPVGSQNPGSIEMVLNWQELMTGSK